MTETPDRPRTTLLRGGSVYSPGAPFATSMLLDGAAIAWIGEDDAAETMAADADRVIDLDGRLVTPGFVDAHVHLAMTGFAVQSVDLGQARSLTQALDMLSSYAATFTGSVLFAQGWDETHWPEGRPPTITEIDRAVGGRPSYVARVDCHSAVVSSALVAAGSGIASTEGWSDDGRVERDAHHRVREVADGLRSAADRSEAISQALDHAASRGITSVHELNAPHIGPYSDFATIARLTAAQARIEVVPYWGVPLTGDEAGGGEDGLLFGFAGDLNIDGAIGSRTAAVHTPYADADTVGHLYLDRDQVRRHVVACTRRDLQAGFHVIGDRAMTEVTAGLVAAAEEVGIDAMVATRHRLEHVEMPSPDHLASLARLGVVASVQPAFDAAWGAPGELYDVRLGWERARPMNPFGSMQAAGVAVAFGSDSPITAIEPWAGVRAAAYHHEPAERMTVRAAFNAHTRGGHRARRDDGAGVLRPGEAATYVIWDVDAELVVQTPDDRVAAWSTDVRAGVPVLPDVRPEVPLPRCVRTVVDGAVVYDGES